MSSIERVRSSSDTEADTRPERMRDWLFRQINSGKFPDLEWLNEEKNVFKVPWVHAKKRGYNKERDAALFRAWAVHSGKYRSESDPTIWKINFRCAINSLKDVQEIKEMQTEDCRVYRVHPSTGRKRVRGARRVRFSSTEPYPSPSSHSYDATQHLYYQVRATDAVFTSQHCTPATKLEYPKISACAHTSLTGYPTPCISSTGHTVPTSSCIMDAQVLQSWLSLQVTPSTGVSVPDSHEQPQGLFFGEPAPPLPPVSTIISDYVSMPLPRLDSPDSGIDMTPCSVQSEFELNHNDQEIVSLVEELEELHSPIPASPKACFNPYQGQLPLQSGDGGKISQLFQIGPPEAEQSSTSQSYAQEEETRTKVFAYSNHFRPALERYAIRMTFPEQLNMKHVRKKKDLQILKFAIQKRISKRRMTEMAAKYFIKSHYVLAEKVFEIHRYGTVIRRYHSMYLQHPQFSHGAQKCGAKTGKSMSSYKHWTLLPSRPP